MKITLSEYDSCFSLDFVAETLEDAAKMSRMAQNCTRELRGVETYVDKTAFNSSIIIGKSKKATSRITNISRARK